LTGPLFSFSYLSFSKSAQFKTQKQRDGLLLISSASMCQAEIVISVNDEEESTMEINRVGVDLAKNVFQLHGADRRGKAVWKRRLMIVREVI
jgi:hypothetical protein